MSANATVFTLSRAARTPLVALVTVAMLLASPRPTLPGLVPPTVAGPAANADHERLRVLVAGLSLEDADAPSPDSHALRRPVTAFAVRLAVDPEARHRLDGRLAVRPDHLGGPARTLRLVSLEPLAVAAAPEPAAATPKPEIQAVEAAPALPPTPAPGRAVSVKNPSSGPSLRPEGPVATPPPAAGPGRSVLVAGDSLSLFLAEAMKPLLANRPGTVFAAKGKISSGLARPDFFDWEREMARQSAAAKPDTVFVMIATNDNQTLTRPDGVKVAFGRPGWEAEYARRVRRMVELARTGNPAARVYWIGAPVMADARLNADVAAINTVIARQIAALPGCRFVDVSRTLADAAGRYVAALPGPSGPRPIRTRDGVHLLPHGAKLLADACLAAMRPSLAALSRP